MTVSTIGFLVPPAPWTAAIAGVASRAIVLVHDDGVAIPVICALGNMDARAICLDGGFHVMAVAAREAGAAATWDGTSLRIGSAVADGGSAVPWDPRSRLATAASAAPAGFGTAIKVALAALAAARAGGRPLEGIHGDGPFAAGFRRLRTEPGFPASIVGFGPGSTPAGDDWLAGYICGRDLAAGGPGRGARALRTELARSMGRTTPAGRALLSGAVAGAPPEYLVELALAVASTERTEGRVREAVLAALGHGATSGEDAITGFAWALAERLACGTDTALL